jgi:hypothetical protein
MARIHPPLLVALASLLLPVACVAPGTGGGITGMDPLGPLAAGPASTALGVAAAVEPTGQAGRVAGMAAGYVYRAEVEAQTAAWKAKNPLPDPQAALATAEAAKQQGIRAGYLNPDGPPKAQPAQ